MTKSVALLMLCNFFEEETNNPEHNYTVTHVLQQSIQNLLIKFNYI